MRSRGTFTEVEGLTCRYRRRSLPLQHLLEDLAVFLVARMDVPVVSRSTMLRLL
jgi:hypothetical protein